MVSLRRQVLVQARQTIDAPQVASDSGGHCYVRKKSPENYARFRTKRQLIFALAAKIT
jgi:hypothetical protein